MRIDDGYEDRMKSAAGCFITNANAKKHTAGKESAEGRAESVRSNRSSNVPPSTGSIANCVACAAKPEHRRAQGREPRTLSAAATPAVKLNSRLANAKKSSDDGREH